MTTRRELFLAFGALALAVPVSALAQKPGKVWRIGLLMEGEAANYVTRLDAFKLGLRELGYTEGRDYVIEPRAVAGEFARLRTLAGELIALKVDLIVATGTPSALATRDLTREIPIVFINVVEPVGSGLAESLRRPGGNVTGISQFPELASKRLDFLRQIVPGLRRVGYLYDPDNASNALSLKKLQSDCAKLGYTLTGAPIRRREEIVAAFRTLQRDKAQGFIVASPASFLPWQLTIIELAATHRLPSIYGSSRVSERGGLISYFVSNTDAWHRAAPYADKIFKGTKPGELPIEQPTKFELQINLKTAKALGLTIPPSVLVQATRVIE